MRYRNKLKSFLFLCFAAALMLSLTGCNDLVAIEDRDFVLAIGISYERSEYVITYALPDLGAITGQGSSEEEKIISTWRGRTMPEIEETYNLSADKRLDYSFLKAIILDESVSKNQDRMQELLGYIENNYEIGRNTLVFYTDKRTEELLNHNQNVGGSVGNYLEKLYNNNAQKRSLKPVTIGKLINCLYDITKVLILPTLTIDNDMILINGGAVYRNDVLLCLLEEEVLQYINMAKGEGSNYILKLSNKSIVKIKKLNNKLIYQVRNKKPYLILEIQADAVIVQDDSDYIARNNLTTEAQVHIKSRLNLILDYYMKEYGIDILNLYDRTSTGSKKIWVAYKGNSTAFTKDLTVEVDADVKIQ